MNYFSWVDDGDINLRINSNEQRPRWSIKSMLKIIKEGIKSWRQDTYLLKRY
jgi:hypothetical protein